VTSRELTVKGFELKKRGLVHKFPVNNNSEQPMMFISVKGGMFMKVIDTQIVEMLQQDVIMDTKF